MTDVVKEELELNVKELKRCIDNIIKFYYKLFFSTLWC